MEQPDSDLGYDSDYYAGVLYDQVKENQLWKQVSFRGVLMRGCSVKLYDEGFLRTGGTERVKPTNSFVSQGALFQDREIRGLWLFLFFRRKEREGEAAF